MGLAGLGSVRGGGGFEASKSGPCSDQHFSQVISYASVFFNRSFFYAPIFLSVRLRPSRLYARTCYDFHLYMKSVALRMKYYKKKVAPFHIAKAITSLAVHSLPFLYTFALFN